MNLQDTEVLKWVVTDVPRTEVPPHDAYRTEWRAKWRDCVLVVLRTRGRFESWVERIDDAGVACVHAHTIGIPALTEAKERAVESAVDVLNRRALTDEDYDALRLPMLVDMEHAYRSAARRAAEGSLFGEELEYQRWAAHTKAQADEIRARVARRLAIKAEVRS